MTLPTSFPIPDSALDDRLGFVGTAGSGKTYNAMSAIERVTARKGRFIWIDALGVAWGFRVMADGGTPSPHDVVIIGGPHGDLPLNEHAGGLIGEAVAGIKESVVVDLSEIGTAAGERRFMLGFLTALYRHASGEPVHLVLDEADLWAPQRILDREGDAAKLQAIVERIVRRGRVEGFIPWLITQRPAVLSKNVLSQVDGLVAFKLTSSQDRDQLGAWIEGQADKAEGRAILARLPMKGRGDAVLWIPGRGILADVTFPPKKTFDSSRTPRRGETAATATLKPLDLGELKDRLAMVEAEAKANDPKALKTRIADLEKRLSVKSGQPAVPEQKAIEEAERCGYDRGHAEGRSEALTAMSRDADAFAGKMRSILEGALSEISGFRATPLPLPDTTRRLVTKEEALRSQPRVNRISEKPISGQPSSKDTGLTGPLQKIVDAIRWWNVLGVAEPSHPQVAFIAGYSHKSGTWATYLSRLRTMGLIIGRGALVLTDEGLATAADPDVQPSGALLRRAVLEKIDGSMKRILEPVLAVYPNSLSHSEAAEASGYSVRSGTWATYLSRLRSLDLIDGRGELRAREWLFP